ncbi:MAG TPA: aldose epimerase family protein [Candidatus Acidoferrales bacterium]|nr:aldose epimerase family protein [Candidatus Acidoferrales bacterium]
MIAKRSFGKTADGKEAHLFLLINSEGVEAQVTDYGATLVALKTPDRHGSLADITAGYDNVAGYEAGRSYFGGTVGRYANRIAHGEFTLNGVKYTLAKNNGPNHLHGGPNGFNKRWWSAEDISTPQEPRLRLRYVSRDGEEGYPGNVNVTVEYALTEANELKLDFEASTDKETILNLTNHSYFNLAAAGDILGHELTIFGSYFLPVDATQIPTGEIRSAAGSPFDFLRPHAIGERIGEDDEQLKIGLGYDHCYVLDKGAATGPALAARAHNPKSGRILEVATTEPGMQLYTGNHLDGSSHGKGKTYTPRTYFCLEVQHFPDSPNHPNFPTTVLRPGETRRAHTVYKFSAK